MSNLIQTPESQSELTLEEKQAAFKRQLSLQITKLFARVSSEYTRIFSSVTSRNPYGLTAKEAVEGLGQEDALELLRLGGVLRAAIVGAKSDAEVAELPTIEELLAEEKE